LDAIIIVEITTIIPSSDKELNEVKGKVISDYQNYLEKNWIIELKKKIFSRDKQRSSLFNHQIS